MEKRKVLIVVDMQNDFVTGSLRNEAAIKILPRVRQKIHECAKNGYEVYFTKDTHFKNYLETQEGKNLPVPHCEKGTWGWEIADGLLIKMAISIEKKSFGYDGWKDFDFENCEILLIGVCTGICVISNALGLKAQFPESEITVDASCCACLTPESHKTALDAMKLCQIKIVNE